MEFGLKFGIRMYLTSTFNNNSKKDYNVPKDFINIYKECLEIYEEINEYSIQI